MGYKFGRNGNDEIEIYSRKCNKKSLNSSALKQKQKKTNEILLFHMSHTFENYFGFTL